MNKLVRCLPYGIAICLFILPFIWFSPNEVEMGGDSNRLFIYDPITYTKVNNFFSVEPEGLGKLRPDHAMLPFMLLLSGMQRIFRSPYLLMCILNGIKLSGSFIFMFLIVIEILRYQTRKELRIHEHLAAIMAGIFYTLSPSVGENFRTALLTHNQVFLNPMIFYLLFRYLITQQSKFMWILLLTTVLFAANFSLMAPPPPLSFYPLAFTSLFIYLGIYLKKQIPWGKLFGWTCVFIGLHVFHFIPEILYIFDPGSLVNLRLFSETVNRNEGLEYFNGILWYGKVISNIFLIHVGEKGRWVSIFVPLVILVGSMVVPKRKSVFTLLMLFFFTTLFLMSANITGLGVFVYRALIRFPAFSMFRNFYGQFQWVHTFFYALILGYTSYYLMRKLRPRYTYIMFACIFSSCIYMGWPYITGEVFAHTLLGSKGITSVIHMDPDYKKALAFIQQIPDDGKIINFPFTDFSYQVVPGINNGAYIGPSTISYLTEKRNFSGYQNIYPFSDVFFSLIEKRDYKSIHKLFGILNIHYILYMRSPKAYVEYFPILPFSHLQKSVPDMNALDELVMHLVSKQIFKQGAYEIYAIDGDSYLPHLYTAEVINKYKDKDDGFGTNASFYISDKSSSLRTAYIENDMCLHKTLTTKCGIGEVFTLPQAPIIRYTRINPTKYKIEVRGASEPFVLVFSDQFNKSWKVYTKPSVAQDDFSQSSSVEQYGSIQKFQNTMYWDNGIFETIGKQSISEDKHFMINGYANGWFISDEDILSSKNFDLIVELANQKITYISFALSFVVVLLCIIYIFRVHV